MPGNEDRDTNACPHPDVSTYCCGRGGCRPTPTFRFAEIQNIHPWRTVKPSNTKPTCQVGQQRGNGLAIGHGRLDRRWRRPGWSKRRLDPSKSPVDGGRVVAGSNGRCCERRLSMIAVIVVLSGGATTAGASASVPLRARASPAVRAMVSCWTPVAFT